MKGKPFPQSYWVQPGLFCAGQFPGAQDPIQRDQKLQGLVHCGIRHVINLMEPQETNYGRVPFDPYHEPLQGLARKQGLEIVCHRFPTPDGDAPTRETMRQVLDQIDAVLKVSQPVYVHCWGGHGRTGTVVACHLIRRGFSPPQALDKVREFRRGLPKDHEPFEGGQLEFVMAWSADF